MLKKPAKAVPLFSTPELYPATPPSKLVGTPVLKKPDWNPERATGVPAPLDELKKPDV